MSRIRTKEDARRRIAELRRELDQFKAFHAQSSERHRRGYAHASNTIERRDWPQLPAGVVEELRSQIRDLKEMMDSLPDA